MVKKLLLLSHDNSSRCIVWWVFFEISVLTRRGDVLNLPSEGEFGTSLLRCRIHYFPCYYAVLTRKSCTERDFLVNKNKEIMFQTWFPHRTLHETKSSAVLSSLSTPNNVEDERTTASSICHDGAKYEEEFSSSSFLLIRREESTKRKNFLFVDSSRWEKKQRREKYSSS